MRIGVNCFLLQANIGGLKQYFINLFRELLAAEDGNQYVFFWYPHNAEELARLGTDRWKQDAVLLQDQREVLAHLDRFDVYFCPFSALYPRPIPRPTVVFLPDIQEVFYPEFFNVEDLYTRDLHFPGSTRMADRVITISEFSKSTFVRFHGLREEKVLVAHLSADPAFYRAEEVARAPGHALPSDFVFYPANPWKHKNHDGLLQALRLLRQERGLAVPLVVTGYPDPAGYPVEAKAEEYGVRDLVHRPGYLGVEEIAYLYRHARMMVFPSLFEGFGIPLVEAMAAGCPVVAADSTSIPEVVADAAELFDPKSPPSIAAAIEKVWRDEETRQRLVERGRIRARAFPASGTAAVHRRAFREAAAAYSPRRFLWQSWVSQHTHRAIVESRWWWRRRRERSQTASMR
jgi:glycosyltransferase involved in cell wall biosynthesis